MTVSLNAYCGGLRTAEDGITPETGEDLDATLTPQMMDMRFDLCWLTESAVLEYPSQHPGMPAPWIFVAGVRGTKSLRLRVSEAVLVDHYGATWSEKLATHATSAVSNAVSGRPSPQNDDQASRDPTQSSCESTCVGGNLTSGL